MTIFIDASALVITELFSGGVLWRSNFASSAVTAVSTSCSRRSEAAYEKTVVEWMAVLLGYPHDLVAA